MDAYITIHSKAKPVFVDIELETFGMDPKDIENIYNAFIWNALYFTLSIIFVLNV